MAERRPPLAWLVGRVGVHCACEEAFRKDADRLLVFQDDRLPDASGCGFYP